MAAAIKALNAKIRSNPTTDYLCSTRTSPSHKMIFDRESATAGRNPDFTRREQLSLWEETDLRIDEESSLDMKNSC